MNLGIQDNLEAGNLADVSGKQTRRYLRNVAALIALLRVRTSLLEFSATLRELSFRAESLAAHFF